MGRSESVRANKRVKLLYENGETSYTPELETAAGLIAGLVTTGACFPYYLELIHSSFAAMKQVAENINDDGALYQFMMINMVIIFKVMITLIPIPLAAGLTHLVPTSWTCIFKRRVPDLSLLRGYIIPVRKRAVIGLLTTKLKCILLLVVTTLFRDTKQIFTRATWLKARRSAEDRRSR